MADLFGGERLRRPRHGATKALVPVATAEVCPNCGARMQPRAMWEPMLFRHGGYGATRRTVRRECSACPWSLVAEVTEVHPDKD